MSIVTSSKQISFTDYAFRTNAFYLIFLLRMKRIICEQFYTE